MPQHNIFDLSGKTAIVTGASRGIGAAAAAALAGAGADVALIGRDAGTLEPVGAGLERLGSTTLSVECDMSVSDQIDVAVDKVLQRFGRIDVLVNNAGIIRRAPAAEYSLEDWSAVLSVNLNGMFQMAQRVGRTMIEQGSGKIINIASLLSFTGGLNVIAYTSSKSAVVGLTRGLANEWARHGVNVNAIAPGYIHTEATAAIRSNPERYNALLARIPAGRWGEPSDLSGPILFLASGASDYVHGHVLVVDGGFLAA